MAKKTYAPTRAGLTVAGLAIVSGLAPSRFADGVPYPSGYRQWTHVKSMVVLPSSSAFATGGGMHHVYANATAMAGFSTGHFPDGAILVFDRLTASENSGVIASAERERLDVMVKDSKRHAATGLHARTVPARRRGGQRLRGFLDMRRVRVLRGEPTEIARLESLR